MIIIIKIYYAKNVSWQQLDNIVYIVDEITKKHFILKDIGKKIWILIDYNFSYNEIIDKLSNEYNVSKEILLHDMKDFINDLVSKNLLIVEGDNYGA